MMPPMRETRRFSRAYNLINLIALQKRDFQGSRRRENAPRQARIRDVQRAENCRKDIRDRARAKNHAADGWAHS